ncbi:hypothetical protein C8F01DRAFT_1240214 [Mycena amicta]|nr:hypothetical protein C8F01DRAFT_1240214 [Mycena amicta]
MQANDDGPSGNAGGSGQQPSEGSRAPTDANESAESKEMARERREEVHKGKRKARSPVPVDEQRERNRQRRSTKIIRQMASEAAAANALTRIVAQETETRKRLEELESQRAEARLQATMARKSDEEMSESSEDSPVDEDRSEREAPEQSKRCEQRDLQCVIDDSVLGCRECERKGVRCSFEDEVPAPVKKTEKIPACENCAKVQKQCFVVEGRTTCELCAGEQAGRGEEDRKLREIRKARKTSEGSGELGVGVGGAPGGALGGNAGPRNIHKLWPARKEQMAEKRKEREPAPKPKKKRSKKIGPEASAPPARSERAPPEPEDESNARIASGGDFAQELRVVQILGERKFENGIRDEEVHQYDGELNVQSMSKA